MKSKTDFHFSYWEEPWLDTVPQISEIPASDVVPKGETFWALVRMQNCPWTGGSQPKSSQTLLTGSAYPTTYKADLCHVTEGTAVCSYTVSGSGNLEWGRSRISDVEMRDSCLVRRDYKRKNVWGPGMLSDSTWHVSQVMKQAVRSSRHKYGPSLLRWVVISNWDKKKPYKVLFSWTFSLRQGVMWRLEKRHMDETGQLKTTLPPRLPFILKRCLAMKLGGTCRDFPKLLCRS